MQRIEDLRRERNELLTEEKRFEIANRLRAIANNLETGEVTPEYFRFEPEWINKPPMRDGTREPVPTGRVLLMLEFWTTPIRSLQ